MKIYRKPLPIYFGDLVIAVGPLDESSKELGINSSIIDPGTDGYACFRVHKKSNRFMFALLITDTPKHNTIVHEALHIVHYVMREIGHKPDYNNDETECYLLGYIVTEIYKFLAKNKIEISI